jgi:hypothetical protein
MAYARTLPLVLCAERMNSCSLPPAGALVLWCWVSEGLRFLFVVLLAVGCGREWVVLVPWQSFPLVVCRRIAVGCLQTWLCLLLVVSSEDLLGVDMPGSPAGGTFLCLTV